MAFCPKCKAEIGMMESGCQACGYDFPEGESEDLKPGWEYSGIADLVLVSGAVVFAIAFLISLMMLVYSVFNKPFKDVMYPALAAHFCAVMFLVIVRSARRN